jgi:hypothetical protein
MFNLCPDQQLTYPPLGVHTYGYDASASFLIFSIQSALVYALMQPNDQILAWTIRTLYSKFAACVFYLMVLSSGLLY